MRLLTFLLLLAAALPSPAAADLPADQEDAAYRAALFLRQQIIAAHGSPTDRPPDAAVQAVVKLPSGQARSVYALDEVHRRYLDAVDALMAADPRGPLLGESGGVTGVDLPAMFYETAQILYNHGQLSEARTRLQKIIDAWPEREEAAFSVSLMLDSFVVEGDLESARRYAHLFIMRPSPSPRNIQQIEVQLAFRDREEEFAFRIAEERQQQARKQAQQGNLAEAAALHIQAAEAFQSFVDENPTSPHMPDAFYNVGYNYREAGLIDKANAIFIAYVERWPESERSWPLLFQIANNYGSTLDLEQSVYYFEVLYHQTEGSDRDYEDAPAALYNAAFLRIGLGDHRGAAQEFEKYAAVFPDLPDAEQVMYQAGGQWERVSAASAVAFYQRYLDRWGDANADRSLEARYQIAALTAASGGDAAAAWRAMIDAYPPLADKAGPLSRHHAAMAEIRLIEPEVEAARPTALSADPQETERLLFAGRGELLALQARLEEIAARYDDPEAATAARYLEGRLYLDLADWVYDTSRQPVDGYEDAHDEGVIDEFIRVPLEERGVALLTQAIDQATAAHAWSPWADKAEALRAEARLGDYPPPHAEIRGQRLGLQPPSAGPLPMRRAGDAPR